MKKSFINLRFKRNITLICAVLVMVSCGKKEEAQSEGDNTEAVKDSASDGVRQVRFTADQYKLAGIETGAIEKRQLSDVIKLNGVIDVEPNNVASVSAPLGGYIKTAGLLPGQQIGKGQVLATLENPEFITLQQEYFESKGTMQYLEAEYKRQQKLRDEDVNAAKTFQKATSDYKVMQAKIDGLEQKLALAGIGKASLNTGKIVRTANIVAPIGGYIKTSNVNIGKYVNPTDVLFEIVNKDDLHLALNAFEKDVNSLHPGQVVKFSLANENNYNRTAKVYLVGKATEANGTTPVHCHLDKKTSDMVPGMYVKAWIETGSQELDAVPSDALVQIEGKDYIILEKSGSKNDIAFEFVLVKKGIGQENYTAVTLPQGINPQDVKVVTKNAYAVLSALKNAEEEE